MKNNILFLLTLLVVSCTGYSQKKAKLPAWFFDPPQSTDEIIYSIGISDPGMSEYEAFQQAEDRALIIMALLEESECASISQNSLQFDKEISEIKMHFQNRATMNYSTSAIQVIQKYYTAHKEAIVLVSKNINTKLVGDKNISVIIRRDLANSQIVNDIKSEDRIEISGECRNHEYSFNHTSWLKSDGNYF